MPIDPKRVRRTTAAMDRDITARVTTFQSALADVWGSLRRRIVELTNTLEAQGGRIQSTAINLGVARRVAADMQRWLAEAGADDLLRGAIDDMGDLSRYRGVGQSVVGRTETNTAWSSANLDAFRQVKMAELAEIPAAAVRAVEQVLLKGIVSAQDRAELINELAGLLDTSLPRATTVYDTALSEYTRLAVVGNARGTDDEAFLFDGPIDAKMRPFCAERVGKVFSRAEIDGMDNGQLDNTLLTGGGYNCRHTWIPVPEDDPLNAKSGTGEYADDTYAEDVAHADQVAARKGGA